MNDESAPRLPESTDELTKRETGLDVSLAADVSPNESAYSQADAALNDPEKVEQLRAIVKVSASMDRPNAVRSQEAHCLVVLQCIASGVKTSSSEIATLMGLEPDTIAKTVKRLINQGVIVDPRWELSIDRSALAAHADNPNQTYSEIRTIAMEAFRAFAAENRDRVSRQELLDKLIALHPEQAGNEAKLWAGIRTKIRDGGWSHALRFGNSDITERTVLHIEPHHKDAVSRLTQDLKRITSFSPPAPATPNVTTADSSKYALASTPSLAVEIQGRLEAIAQDLEHGDVQASLQVARIAMEQVVQAVQSLGEHAPGGLRAVASAIGHALRVIEKTSIHTKQTGQLLTDYKKKRL